MDAPLAHPLQLDFRIRVVEATHVPKEYKTLEVAWKKGVKCLATRPAAVQRGRAEWNEDLIISASLCRVNGQAHFQAKHCWLQISSDDGSVLGHDKVNLAECADGQARDRMLQIWKAQSSFVRINLKVTIQALGGVHGQEVLAPAFPRRSSSPHRPSSSSDGRSVKTFRALSDLSPEGEALRTPGASPIQRAWDFPGLPGPRIKASFSQLELDALEASSQHASSTKDLAPRLVLLCNRQLRAAQLSAAEQEEAMQEFILKLRRSREPSASCGVLFSGRAVPSIVEDPPEADVVVPPKEEAPLPPSLFSSPLYLDLQQEADARTDALARPLTELEDYLRSARSLALAMAREEVQASASLSVPVSPLASVTGPSPAPSSAPELSKDKAASWNSRAELGQEQGGIEEAIAKTLHVQDLTGKLDLAAEQCRRARAVLCALDLRLQEMARDREFWIHRCLSERELQKANSLCKRGLHERSLAAPLCA